DDLPLEKRGSGHEEPRRWTRKALLQPVEDAPAVLAGEEMVRLRAYPPHGGGQRHVTAEANPIGDRHDSVVVLLRDAVVEAQVRLVDGFRQLLARGLERLERLKAESHLLLCPLEVGILHFTARHVEI